MRETNCTMCKHMNRSTGVAAMGICLSTESKLFAYQVSKLTTCEFFEQRKLPRKDLSFGLDSRGDYALFIDVRHIKNQTIDEAVKKVLPERDFIFFRVINEGEDTSSHGWIGNKKIVQWG